MVGYQQKLHRVAVSHSTLLQLQKDCKMHCLQHLAGQHYKAALMYGLLGAVKAACTRYGLKYEGAKLDRPFGKWLLWLPLG